MDQYSVLGVMSGSSLDGLDLCLTRFNENGSDWTFEIMAAETIQMQPDLITRLRNADQLSGENLIKLDMDYGLWIGGSIQNWLKSQPVQPELIGVHGHTVFHAPKNMVSLQIGNGLGIAQTIKIPVVDQFRILDILKGGQGAPLVPAGEKYLFPGYEAFLNLGGISNISIHKRDRIMAWDIAPCNQVFNHYAHQAGRSYDADGALAKEGNLDKSWLNFLEQLDYFQADPPKSLSNQWTNKVYEGAPENARNALHTYSRFLSRLIAKEINQAFEDGGKVLVTGGGTFNNYLINQIKSVLHPKIELVVPSDEIISFKEALIFGFLALLRKKKQVNIFHSVTGAESDSAGGLIHNPL